MSTHLRVTCLHFDVDLGRQRFCHGLVPMPLMRPHVSPKNEVVVWCYFWTHQLWHIEELAPGGPNLPVVSSLAWATAIMSLPEGSAALQNCCLSGRRGGRNLHSSVGYSFWLVQIAVWNCEKWRASESSVAFLHEAATFLLSGDVAVKKKCCVGLLSWRHVAA